MCATGAEHFRENFHFRENLFKNFRENYTLFHYLYLSVPIMCLYIHTSVFLSIYLYLSLWIVSIISTSNVVCLYLSMIL